MKYNAAFLVVLYNCEIQNSDTLNTLIKRHYENTLLVIWNNGPYRLNDTDTDISILSKCGLKILIKETIGNESLSGIYNQFIHEHKAGKYIILDHDSKVSLPYLYDTEMLEEDKLGIPLIYSLGKSQSPTINGGPLPSKSYEIKPSDMVKGIGSGIVIGANIVKYFDDKFEGSVFDERFYLYGVDTSFFYRYHQLFGSEHIQIVHGFEHSLSKLIDEPDDIKSFRKLERTYDKALSLRFYKSKKEQIRVISKTLLKIAFVPLIKIIKPKKPVLYYFIFIKAYLSGKHYKNH
jgi:hypothetical protein